MRSGLLKEITLQFAASKQRICCTRGEVAEKLAARLARGARSLADALHSWLSTDQTWQLQNHIEKGRLVLWLELPTSEEFGAVCGRLVQASPHGRALQHQFRGVTLATLHTLSKYAYAVSFGKLGRAPCRGSTF